MNRSTMCALVGGSISLLLANSCGDDDAVLAGDDSEDAADEAEGTGSIDGTCLLDADTASDAVGVEVTLDGFTFGGTSGTARVRVYLDPDTTDVSREDPEYSVSWQGCIYAADDGAEYMAGELVDEDSNPDASGFDQLLTLASVAAEEPAHPEVGDEAFFGREELVVRSGDRTLVLGFTPNFHPNADDMAALVDVATAIVDGEHSDIGAMCHAAIAVAPETWSPVDALPLLGGGGVSIDGVDYSYDMCSVSLMDGEADLDIKLGEAELYDASDTSSDTPDPEIPEVVDGIGDDAVWMSDRLYIRVGDRALTASGTTASDEPADRSLVEALGMSAAETLG